MTRFRYSGEIVDAFPTTCGGVVHATGLANTDTPPDLLAAYQGEQHTVRERLGDGPLSEIPSLAAWRREFSGFGVKPTQYRNEPPRGLVTASLFERMEQCQNRTEAGWEIPG